MKRQFLILAVTMAASLAMRQSAAADTKSADPNKYSTYEMAMAPVQGDPMAVEWQDANRAAIDAATAPEVLAKFVADAASAAKLLDQIKPAYETHPLLLTQIAAVTQWVMQPDCCWLCFWKPSPAAGRKVWVAALEAKIASASDGYIKTFCRQQLDICR